jgi:hypothetical protein
MQRQGRNRCEQQRGQRRPGATADLEAEADADAEISLFDAVEQAHARSNPMER